MRVLGRIRGAASPPPRAGTLRRRELEAFGDLLAELDGGRAVLVTGEDRARTATTAIGLAAAAAATGTRTALLESDLAAPSLAEALGLATAPGLGEHLRGEVEAGRVLQPIALAGPGSAAAREPLVCVVAGHPTGDGTALLGSDAFPAALAGLRDAYELLVIAGAPLPDGDGTLATVAEQADATLLCVGGSDEIPSPPIAVAGIVVVD